MVHAGFDPWSIWLIGELYGISRLSETNRLLEDLAQGRVAGSELNGHFLIFAWNSEMRQWHVWTDRFGSLHAYYGVKTGRAALGTFSPSVAAIASDRKLDWYGLIGYFGFGFFPHDRTFFEDVRILRPASHYTFDANGTELKRESYWEWWHEPDTKRTYDETVEEFGRILEVVTREHTAIGKIAIPISGGLDSRCMVASVADVHSQEPPENLWAYSYGYSDDSVETRIASRIASARRIPFQAYTIKPYLFDGLESVLSAVEGFQDLTQTRQSAVMNDVSMKADSVLAAHLGDLWLGDMGFSGVHDDKVTEATIASYAQKKVTKNGSSWLLQNLCRPRLEGMAPETVLEGAIQKEIHSLRKVQDPDFRLKAFKTGQWCFRWTAASLRAYQIGAFPRLPFYDVRLTDFFSGVPSHFFRRRQLQIDYLKRFAPDLARVTWQAYDANLFQYKFFDSLLLPKRAIKKAWRSLNRKEVIQRNWEVQFLCESGRSGLHYWLLRPGLRIHEFVSPRDINHLLDSFYQRLHDPGLGYTVSMLLTFSSWMEQYG